MLVSTSKSLRRALALRVACRRYHALALWCLLAKLAIRCAWLAMASTSNLLWRALDLLFVSASNLLWRALDVLCLHFKRALTRVFRVLLSTSQLSTFESS